MTLREQFQNNAETTLNGAINNSTTSVVVTDGSVFPSTGNFRLIVEDEIMLVTARSTNTLTVVRGQEGTTGASHSDSIVVTHILTTGSLDRFGKDNDALHGSSRPVLASIVDGSTLVASDFTWVNQDSAVRNDHNGTITLRKPAQSGESVTALVRTAPGTPYTITAAFQGCFICDDSGATPHWGLCFRRNGGGDDGKLIMLSINNASLETISRLAVYRYNSATSATSDYKSRRNALIVGPYIWLKLEDDGTNLKFYTCDGIEWIQIHSISRTDFMGSGPNQVGIYMSNYQNDNEALLRLCHWSVG